jgi:hypothetical protein
MPASSQGSHYYRLRNPGSFYIKVFDTVHGSCLKAIGPEVSGAFEKGLQKALLFEIPLQPCWSIGP